VRSSDAEECDTLLLERF